MKVLIKVTEQILEKSRFCSQNNPDTANKVGFNCAIALAIRDILPNAWVGGNCIYSNIDNKIKSVSDLGIKDGDINLPTNAAEFISRFDRNRPEDRLNMEPISFEIDFPDELVEKIGIDEVKEILNNSKTLELAI